jgi:hypothetical protein
MIRRTHEIHAVAASTPPSCKSTPAAGCEPARVSVFTRPYFTASSACAFAFRKWSMAGGEHGLEISAPKPNPAPCHCHRVRHHSCTSLSIFCFPERWSPLGRRVGLQRVPDASGASNWLQSLDDNPAAPRNTRRDRMKQPHQPQQTPAYHTEWGRTSIGHRQALSLSPRLAIERCFLEVISTVHGVLLGKPLLQAGKESIVGDVL